MLRENGSELALDLTNGARTGELNADDGGERALVPSSASKSSLSCLIAPSRVFSAPICHSFASYCEIGANIDPFVGILNYSRR